MAPSGKVYLAWQPAGAMLKAQSCIAWWHLIRISVIRCNTEHSWYKHSHPTALSIYSQAGNQISKPAMQHSPAQSAAVVAPSEKVV
jgi:hypothetical protein